MNNSDLNDSKLQSKPFRKFAGVIEQFSTIRPEDRKLYRIGPKEAEVCFERKINPPNKSEINSNKTEARKRLGKTSK